MNNKIEEIINSFIIRFGKKKDTTGFYDEYSREELYLTKGQKEIAEFIKQSLNSLLKERDNHWKAVIDKNEDNSDKHRDFLMEHIPMGVSQWKEYGKRYGYWDYFKKEILKEVRDDVLQNQSGQFEDDAGNICWYLDDLKDKLNKLIKEL